MAAFPHRKGGLGVDRRVNFGLRPRSLSRNDANSLAQGAAKCSRAARTAGAARRPTGLALSWLRFERREQTMPQFEIRVFDPQTASPELWASYHACTRAIAEELRPGDAVLSDAEFEIEERRDHPLYDCVRWVALAGQDVAGSASALFRRPGSPDSAAYAPHIDAGAAVRAEFRRQGAGTMLLREVLGLMHRLDKTVLTLGAHMEPGHSFLTWAGAEPKLTNRIEQGHAQGPRLGRLARVGGRGWRLRPRMGALCRPRAARGAAGPATGVHGAVCRYAVGRA